MLKQPSTGLVPESTKELLLTQYRKDLDIWVCRWFGILDSVHFKTCYNRIFEEAKQCHYWLVDIRGRGKASQEDYSWLFSFFLPDKVSKFQKHHFLAYLMTPSHYNYVKESKYFSRLEDLARTTPLKVRIFQVEQEAIDWLLLAQGRN